MTVAKKKTWSVKTEPAWIRSAIVTTASVAAAVKFQVSTKLQRLRDQPLRYVT
jgi:hypothetical protein